MCSSDLIGSANLVASDNVSITTGGPLTLNGAINAGVNNVTLNVTGGISGSGRVTADTLNVTATATSAINTAVDTLVANVTSGDLTVFETNGLEVASANVAAGSLTLQLAAGDETASQGVFLDCWTRKEALLKALGTGFAGGASGFHVGPGPGDTLVPTPGQPVAALRVRSLALPIAAHAAIACAPSVAHFGRAWLQGGEA